jgi:hypothetical protein
MMRDRLFLLAPNFADPAYPGQRFHCPESSQLEGLLAALPELAQRIDVERVDFERPRRSVIALVGDENQMLPLLVLAAGGPEPVGTQRHKGVSFVRDIAIIAQALSARHGFPQAHP